MGVAMIVEYIPYRLNKHATDSREETFAGFEAAYRAESRPRLFAGSLLLHDSYRTGRSPAGK
jgi:hypothetical protein